MMFFFSGFHKFLVIFLGEPAVHFPGRTFEQRKEFVRISPPLRKNHHLSSSQFRETKMEKLDHYVTICLLLAFHKRGEVMT